MRPAISDHIKRLIHFSVFQISITEERVHLHGIVELGDESAGCKKVTSFLEKPKPDMTTSRNQSPCFYLLHSSSVQLVIFSFYFSVYCELDKHNLVTLGNR
jgi:UTP-glucose-1-phosphate uridylyltransferase